MTDHTTPTLGRDAFCGEATYQAYKAHREREAREASAQRDPWANDPDRTTRREATS